MSCLRIACQPWVLVGLLSVGLATTLVGCATPDRGATPMALAPTPTPTPTPSMTPPVEAKPPLAASAATAPPYRLPGPTQLGYEVTGKARGQSYTLQSQLRWSPSGDRYSITQRIEAFLIGSRSQTSSGRIVQGGLQPERYVEQSRQTRSVVFDYGQRLINFDPPSPSSAPGPQPSSTPPVALLAGAQDQLSVLLQLGFLIASQPGRYPIASQISLQTANVRGAELWQFRLENAESLDLPGGRVATLKLSRSPRHESDQKLEVWLAPGMAYLPVRIRLAQADGDVADQRWRSTERL